MKPARHGLIPGTHRVYDSVVFPVTYEIPQAAPDIPSLSRPVPDVCAAGEEDRPEAAARGEGKHLRSGPLSGGHVGCDAPAGEQPPAGKRRKKKNRGGEGRISGRCPGKPAAPRRERRGLRHLRYSRIHRGHGSQHPSGDREAAPPRGFLHPGLRRPPRPQCGGSPGGIRRLPPRLDQERKTGDSRHSRPGALIPGGSRPERHGPRMGRPGALAQMGAGVFQRPPLRWRDRRNVYTFAQPPCY